MTERHFACIVGARPNFMKMAPILRALDAHPEVSTTLIHTGQHYDADLSDVFFSDLAIEPPAHFLNVGGGKQGEQTARLLEALEAQSKNQFHVISEAETAKMKKAAEPVFDRWYAEMKKIGIDGPKLVSDARKLIDKYSK